MAKCVLTLNLQYLNLWKKEQVLDWPDQEIITEAYVGLLLFNKTAALFMMNKIRGTSQLNFDILKVWGVMPLFSCFIFEIFTMHTVLSFYHFHTVNFIRRHSLRLGSDPDLILSFRIRPF
jgi:hypothetical protein